MMAGLYQALGYVAGPKREGRRLRGGTAAL